MYFLFAKHLQNIKHKNNIEQSDVENDGNIVYLIKLLCYILYLFI